MSLSIYYYNIHIDSAYVTTTTLRFTIRVVSHWVTDPYYMARRDLHTTRLLLCLHPSSSESFHTTPPLSHTLPIHTCGIGLSAHSGLYYIHDARRHHPCPWSSLVDQTTFSTIGICTTFIYE